MKSTSGNSHNKYIGECGSTLYVGLTGTFQTLILKGTGMVPPFLRFFSLGLKRATTMNK